MGTVKWEGVEGAEENHRTTGTRAWCLTDHEWCYPHEMCDCCHYALEHEKVWIDANGDKL